MTRWLQRCGTSATAPQRLARLLHGQQQELLLLAMQGVRLSHSLEFEAVHVQGALSRMYVVWRLSLCHRCAPCTCLAVKCLDRLLVGRAGAPAGALLLQGWLQQVFSCRPSHPSIRARSRTWQEQEQDLQVLQEQRRKQQQDGQLASSSKRLREAAMVDTAAVSNYAAVPQAAAFAASKQRG